MTQLAPGFPWSRSWIEPETTRWTDSRGAPETVIRKPITPADVRGVSFRKDGRIIHNPERELIADMDALPWVTDVYRRDLQIDRYSIGYLLEPYISLSTGRACPAQCTFCLWPQTIGGHRYRVRSPENVAAEMAHAKKLFPDVKEFFFDDDTLTANLPRAREIAKRLKPLGLACRAIAAPMSTARPSR